MYIFFSFLGGLMGERGLYFLYEGVFLFFERGIWSYDDHDDDDDDECVEDEICDFENFQLNEIESSFFPFPGGFFFFVLFLFIVAIYVIYI